MRKLLIVSLFISSLNAYNQTVSINDPASVAEGDVGTAQIDFAVSIDASDPVAAIMVDYAISGGIENGATNTLTFAANTGTLTQTVSVTTNGDTTVEADEAVTVTLSNASPNAEISLTDNVGSSSFTNDDSATNTFPDNGNVGIGTTNPNYPLEIKSESVSGQEEIWRFWVDDAPNDYVSIANGTNANNQFIPIIKGYHESDNRVAYAFVAETSPTMDNGTSPLMIFDSRVVGGQVNTRPLFGWNSYAISRMIMLANGNLLIGKTSQQNDSYKLDVNGSIRANEVRVNTDGADFVFEPDYKLKSLDEVETFVKQHKHLPDIAPAEEMKTVGTNLGEMNTKLLQKIEELTLYVIDLQKQVNDLKSQLVEQP